MNAKGTSATVATSGNFPFPRHRRSRPILVGRLAAIAVAGCLTMSTANATLITFDDLPADVIDPFCSCFVPTAVTNQYESLGVIFTGGGIGGGILSGGAGVVSEPNVLTDFYGPDLGISFTGALPTVVKLYVSSANGDAVFIDAVGPGGFLSTHVTDGFLGNDEGLPYRDRQLVTFTGAEISGLGLVTNFRRRGALEIDDLSFTREVAEISEPAALGLVAVALALLLGIRRHAVN
jgi:hypothetical protein